ncbi:MAG: sigma-54-dependent Fis family transcriptional regulator [Magnetococcales bacterium]|nr:sigma-54-dependent Fis family transcriptional regulator [Magnetococcales bacterium]MBF0151140.1 sigma-54-dependent Fis family transcriptional regulator [Magnetococcales bacterium]MBF0630973.1 sigma-54-dependent Fis family transcriptional regulator [Magnetococcales bacterium]
MPLPPQVSPSEWILNVTEPDDEGDASDHHHGLIDAPFDGTSFPHELVYDSPVMKTLVRRARHVAALDFPVLIQGESGTGKDVLARMIHHASARQNHPFICVNCGAIPENLVEAELFGHEKGAFTGAVLARNGYIAEADKGTLFLDEIGELPLSTQVKLLRVIQEREVIAVGSVHPRKVDFRILAATNRDLLQEVSRGRFRNDLFHRLAVAVFTIPPLRERQEDLAALIQVFVSMINRDMLVHTGYKKRKLTDNARTLLLHHGWPGNIRELYNTLLRAILWSENNVVKSKDIQEAMFGIHIVPPATILGREFGRDFKLTDLLTQVADHYFEKALRESGGNKSLATRLLGLPNATTFSNWKRKYPWKKT